MILFLRLNRKLTYLFVALLLVCFGETNFATGQQPNEDHPNRRSFRFNFRDPRQCAGGNITMGGELVVTFQNDVRRGRVRPEWVKVTTFSGSVQSGDRKLRATSVDLKDVEASLFGSGTFKIEMIVTGPALPGGLPLRLRVLFAPNNYKFENALVTDFNPDRTPKVDCINP
jgi:hypothetical protein